MTNLLGDSLSCFARFTQVCRYSALEYGQITQIISYIVSYWWWAEKEPHVLLLLLNYDKTDQTHQPQISILIMRERFGKDRLLSQPGDIRLVVNHSILSKSSPLLYG